MASVPANPSSSYQLREAGYFVVAASTAIQTMTLYHMPAASVAALATRSTVHGSAIVAMHGVNINR